MFRQQAKPRGEVEQHLCNLRILGANYLVTGDHELYFLFPLLLLSDELCSILIMSEQRFHDAFRTDRLRAFYKYDIPFSHHIDKRSCGSSCIIKLKDFDAIRRDRKCASANAHGHDDISRRSCKHRDAFVLHHRVASELEHVAENCNATPRVRKYLQGIERPFDRGRR